jgi:hypothetical protein
MTSDSRDEVKFRELIAKRLEEIADQNEKDGSHDAPFPAWIAGIRDAAGFVKYERFTKDEIAEQWPTAKDKLIIEMSQRICTCGHRGHEHHAEGYSCERCICPEFYLMHLAKGPYDDLTPVPVPKIQPVEVACILNAVSSDGIVHLDCEIKGRSLEESLEIQIRLSEFESVYRYIVGGLDDEGEGFTTSKEESEELAATNCEKCGHLIALHSALVGCMRLLSQPEVLPYKTCRCEWLPTPEPKRTVSPSCKKCGHTEAMHVNDGLGCMDVSKDAEPDIDAFPRCHCPKFATTAEQSESYLQSAQSERSSPSQEPQLPAHSQCKYQHGQIVEDLLVHMDCIQESGLQAWPATDWEQFFLSLPARWKCEEAECQVFRTLVARALNNLRLVLMSSRPTHRAHPNSASPTE